MSRRGRMRVILTIHGGEQALMDVMEGLVQRNERSLREGAIPRYEQQSSVAPAVFPMWRDAVSALADGVASAGTIAAWQAADDRVAGKPARIAMVGGIPSVVYVDPRSGHAQVGRVPPPMTGRGTRRAYDVNKGRLTEHMVLTIDDDLAMPVREINTAIAHHNSRQIPALGLPKLYESGVYYKVEGSPELWWDAAEIYRNGFDDCEGLAAYRAGELIADEGLNADVYTRYIEAPRKPDGSRGGRIFHAITRVKTADGRVEYDDPSVRLGMPLPGWYSDFARKVRAEGREL